MGQQGLIVALVFGAAINWLGVSFSSALFLAGGFAALFVYSLYVNQEKMLYQPRAFPQYKTAKDNPPQMRSPEEYGIPFEDVRLRAEDGTPLHAWFLLQPNVAERPTLLFFHANAGNMGMRLPSLVQLYRALRVNVFVLSYRGYGESGGEPSEKGLVMDAEAAWQHVTSDERVDKDQIVVFGRSLGGAVAVSVAARHHKSIRCVVLENTFTNIGDMTDSLFPFLRPCRKHLVRLDWPSLDRVQRITAPALFLSGERDEVVPSQQMKRLYQAAVNARFRTISYFPEGMHNNTWEMFGYVDELRDFLKRADVNILDDAAFEKERGQRNALMAMQRANMAGMEGDGTSGMAPEAAAAAAAAAYRRAREDVIGGGGLKARIGAAGRARAQSERAHESKGAAAVNEADEEEEEAGAGNRQDSAKADEHRD